MEQHLLPLNGIHLNIHVAGPETGRPVWLLHGFPECWHSWREQIPVLVAAGYRVFVPEMRGYGASSAPAAVEDYRLLALCGDIQAALDAFGHERACVVGHDWGAVVAWHLALLEPVRIQALATLSVPFAGRPRRPAIEILRKVHAGHFNYILYFQEPGVAERELDADIDRTLLAFMQGGNADALFLAPRPADSRLLDGLPAATLPDWCSPEDFAQYRKAFAGRGFRGALNWYRNFERNWQDTEALVGRKVEQPTLFIIGARDPVATLEAFTLERMPLQVPDLRLRRLEDAGHWLQSEKAETVNALLLDFLGQTYPA
ncbi:alpha/beta hydrolase [Pseudomonas sp. A46]|nr:alpha/beta hydrolase [Pseudomonas sp. A46]OWJ94982.1 alpha/beta hydrolase [Pseudomonas sp. A46]